LGGRDGHAEAAEELELLTLDDALDLPTVEVVGVEAVEGG
jgi:hypothetical protein